MAKEKSEGNEAIEKEQYLNSFAADFAAIMKKNNEAGIRARCVKTGYPELDRQLGGGMFEGKVHFLSAPPGAGKTTLASNIAYKISERGEDVLYISLEMEQTDIVAKMVSMTGYENEKLKYRDYLPTCLSIATNTGYELLKSDIDRKFRREIMNTAFDTFIEKAGRHMKIAELRCNRTLKDVVREIDNYIRFTGKKPAIIVDYLQYISTPDGKAGTAWDVKQALDDAIRKFIEMAKTNRMPFLILGALKRDAYGKEEADISASAGTQGIEYNADVAMQLLPVLTDMHGENISISKWKELPEKKFKITFAKNRFSPGGEVEFLFTPGVCHIMEIPPANTGGAKACESLKPSTPGQKCVKRQLKQEEEDRQTDMFAYYDSMALTEGPRRL